MWYLDMMCKKRPMNSYFYLKYSFLFKLYVLFRFDQKKIFNHDFVILKHYFPWGFSTVKLVNTINKVHFKKKNHNCNLYEQKYYLYSTIYILSDSENVFFPSTLKVDLFQVLLEVNKLSKSIELANVRSCQFD